MANSKFSSMVLLLLNIVRNAIIFVDSLIIGIVCTIQVKNFILSITNKQLLGSSDLVYLLAGFIAVGSFVLCIYLIVKTIIQISDYMMFMRADNYFFGIALDYGFTSYFTTILGILWLGSLNIVAVALINSGKASNNIIFAIIALVVWLISVYAFMPKRKENHNDFNNIVYKNDVYSQINTNSMAFDFGLPTGGFEENKSAFEYTEQLGYEVEDEEAAIAAAKAETKTVEITDAPEPKAKKKLSFNIPTFTKQDKNADAAPSPNNATPNAQFAQSAPAAQPVNTAPAQPANAAPAQPAFTPSFNIPQPVSTVSAPAAPVASPFAVPQPSAAPSPVSSEPAEPTAPSFTISQPVSPAADIPTPSAEKTANGIPADLYYTPSSASSFSEADEEADSFIPDNTVADTADSYSYVPPVPSFTAPQPAEPAQTASAYAPVSEQPVETNSDGIPTNLYYTASAKPEPVKEEKPAAPVVTPSYNPVSNATHVVHQSLVDPTPTDKKPVEPSPKPEAKPAKPKKEPKKKKEESTFIVYTDTFVNRKQK